MMRLREHSMHVIDINFCLVSHDPFHPIKGGGCLRFRKLAEALSKKGDVHFVGPTEDLKDTPVILHPFRLFAVSMFDKSKALKYAVFTLLLIPILVRVCKKNKIDVLVAHNPDAGFAAVIAGKILGIRVVVDTTDIFAEYMVSYGITHKILKSFVAATEYYAYRNADRVVVVSESMKSFVVSKGVDTKKTFVVYDGAETKKFKTSKKNSKPTIIRHGGIDKYDNVDCVVHAAKIVVSKKKDAMFYIVGDGICLNEIKALVKKYGLEKNFVFTGWVPYTKVPKYLAMANIGIVSRASTPANHLVLTLQLLEYWASGTCVVAPKLKAIEEILTDSKNGFLYEPENPDELAKKILFALKNKKAMSSAKANGRKTLEKKFEWAPLISRLAKLCES